ncbi:glutamate-rich WD repeat-containing protein 1-like isoform X2 [Corticium candelabrum]|uniref:glutamate-rich WD repeat-containing protein 1-like isoform X2 n=1 Tax=Corticium candelabrum TaxID=121492 RepID=UPI002E2631CB|nr:glutamate-rich WD repeat-containing protein 1-like isoform X2 [Corticium candelabrum]
MEDEFDGDSIEPLEVDMEADDDSGGDKDKKKSMESAEGTAKSEPNVYLPGRKLEDDEELVHDSTAYHMYHSAQSGDPCLSFDILKDTLGMNRTEYPMTCYLVGGTQSGRLKDSLLVIKMHNLQRTSKERNEDDDDDDAESDSDESIDGEQPEMETVMIEHHRSVNRVRCSAVNGRHLVATWSASSDVYVWDIATQIAAVDNPVDQPAKPVGSKSKKRNERVHPVFTFSGHSEEGFAIDWSTTVAGRLATGDCNSNIHIWQPDDNATWHVDQRPYKAHSASVEDIQWSPNEASVFASCSVDKTVRIWDIRPSPSKACMLTTEAHDSDVNVISWNKNDHYIISGGDDGIVKVWDLRKFQSGESVAMFKHHSGPITSLEWHPTDSSVFGASGEDNQISLWDLAVEKDNVNPDTKDLDVPPQLLFVHMGQEDIKEIHWHPQIPGVMISTAQSGFNIFKSISV